MDSLSNNLGIVLGVIPGLVALTVIKFNAGKPWCLPNLLSGMALIGISVFLLITFADWEGIFELMKSKGVMSAGEHEKNKSTLAVWLVMFPAVFGGIGVNVLSEWLLTKRPD